MPDLSDIIGQDAAVEQLRRAMASERMPHAMLFAGPDGVGRRTTALALAKTLLCEGDAPNGDCCNTCESCRLLETGAHPDFLLVYKELAKYHDNPAVRGRVMQGLGIDVIRSFLIAPAGRSPSRGRGKVFVVLEADLLSPDAQNSLLKTLEEPPAGVTILLISERPAQLLPTTRSRCATVRFGPLPHAFVVERLTGEGVDSTEAQFWATFTDGSVGRAAELASHGLYEIKRELVARIGHLSPIGDAELAEHVKKVAEALATQAVKEAKKADGSDLSVLLAGRRATGTLLQILGSAFRDALHLACGAPDGKRLIHADQTDAIGAIAKRMDTLQLTEVIEQLSEYERLLWRNVSAKTVWDNVIITCASAAPLRV